MGESERERERGRERANVCNRKSPFSTTKIESFFPVGVEDMQVRCSSQSKSNYSEKM